MSPPAQIERGAFETRNANAAPPTTSRPAGAIPIEPAMSVSTVATTPAISIAKHRGRLLVEVHERSDGLRDRLDPSRASSVIVLLLFGVLQRAGCTPARVTKTSRRTAAFEGTWLAAARACRQ